MKKNLNIKSKVYIIGSVGSGKTTFAKYLSENKNIPLYDQDNIIHVFNRKRNEYERDQIFEKIINLDSWIIEGVYHKYFEEGLKKADNIIILDPPHLIVKYRIIIRWLKQKLKFKRFTYTPSIRMLFLMLKWNREYNIKKEILIASLNEYKDKIVILKSTKEII
ncbi:MAG: DNA topology modulation protein FlaR [Clostridia bacterium]